jgi:TorA maturation chaperone TorD
MNNTLDSGFDLALNMARQALYRFTAISLLDPRQGAWQRLREARRSPVVSEAAELVRAVACGKPVKLGSGERDISGLNPAPVLKALPDSLAELNTLYEQSFGLLVSKACPAYETEYIDSKYSFQRSNALADIAGFYRAFGLTTSDDNRDRVDYIVFELEFMAVLLTLERNAATTGTDSRDEQLEICRAAQVRFMREHLGWWAPPFAKLLSRETEGTFYANVADLLAALIPAERVFLGIDRSANLASASLVEHPEACDGCQLGF